MNLDDPAIGYKAEERLELSRSLYKRLAGRRDMNMRIMMCATGYVDCEIARARVNTYATALDDLVRLSGFTEDELKR